MTIQEEVTIEVGQSVDVSLESMMGSTGYGWELTALKGNINLVSMSVQPTSTRPIAPVIQIFSFRGVGEGSGKAVFVLTAPWKVEEPKKQVTYTFNVVKAEDADTDDALRLEGFTAPPTATVRTTPPIALYAVNPPPRTCMVCRHLYTPRLLIHVFYVLRVMTAVISKNTASNRLLV